jgi:hypothetical protein
MRGLIMREEIVNASHLDRLPVTKVHYAPRGLDTVAIPVTEETIGAMAIEFGVEIRRNSVGLYLDVALERKGDAGPTVQRKILHLSDWLVALDYEIHVFPHNVMWNTFGQVSNPQHEMAEEQFLGLVTKQELIGDVKAEGTGFQKLPVELTADRKLPDLPA